MEGIAKWRDFKSGCGACVAWQEWDSEGIRLLKIVSEKLQSQWGQLFHIEENKDEELQGQAGESHSTLRD